MLHTSLRVRIAFTAVATARGFDALYSGTVNANDPNNPFLEPDSFIDPLADGNGCTRDLPYLQQLGINAIRVYSVNSSLNHDSCMNTFSQANIYTMFVVLRRVFARSLIAYRSYNCQH